MSGWDTAAADVTQSASQAAIADTLIDSNDHALGTVSELYERTEAANTPDANGLYPDDYPPGAEPQEQEAEQEQIAEGDWSPDPTAEEELEELQYDLRDEMALRLAEEQAQQAPQAQTPQAMLAEVDQLIAECELNSPERFTECAAGLCSALGLEQGDVHPGITNTLTRAAISAAFAVKGEMAGQYPNGIPPVGPEAVQIFSNEFVGMLGGDARLLPQENQQYITQTNFDGLRNMIWTAEALGWPEDPSQVNDAQMAAHFMGRITAGFGGDPNTVDQINALKTVDWLYRDIVRPAVLALAERQPAPREAPQRTAQRASSRTKARQQFQTNQDIFDDDTMHTLAMEQL